MWKRREKNNALALDLNERFAEPHLPAGRDIERALAEFAPAVKRAELSLDRVEDFLTRHIDETSAVQITLEEQEATKKDEVAEIVRQKTVASITHDTLVDARSAIRAKMRALEAPKPSAAELNDVGDVP